MEYIKLCLNPRVMGFLILFYNIVYTLNNVYVISLKSYKRSGSHIFKNILNQVLGLLNSQLIPLKFFLSGNCQA